MTNRRRIVLVHAHPDDECLFTGGLIARHAAAGDEVCLVTCTLGELGEVADLPELQPVSAVVARLGEVRTAELRESCRQLGPIDLRLLGYRDSGMAGRPGNLDPRAFVQQPLAEVVDRIVAVLREVRPQVVVTYDAFGGYGHPDHIRAHDATMAALAPAADPAYRPELGPAHQVAKVFHTALPRGLIRRGLAVATEDDARALSIPEEMCLPDEQVTASVDVSAFVELKLAALAAHRTQLGTTERFLGLSAPVRQVVFGTEAFVLASTTLSRPSHVEDDLFDGIAL